MKRRCSVCNEIYNKNDLWQVGDEGYICEDCFIKATVSKEQEGSSK